MNTCFGYSVGMELVNKQSGKIHKIVEFYFDYEFASATPMARLLSEDGFSSSQIVQFLDGSFRIRQKPSRDEIWDIRFLRMAEMVASWSKDPSTKCGAVLVRPDKTIASLGFNGFPRGCDDSPDIYADRERKYSRVVHAEVNAVVACKESSVGYTLYTWPPGYGPSCDRCTAVVIQAGVKRVVHAKAGGEGFQERWKAAVESGLQMYAEAGVEVREYELERVYSEKTCC